MSAELGTCGLCEAKITITDDFPATFLKCDHFFHHDCISDWRKETNSCPTCQKVLTIVPFNLPWTLTLSTSDQSMIEQTFYSRTFFPSNRSIVIEGRTLRLPSIWIKRWRKKVMENNASAVNKLITFHLRRIQNISLAVLKLYAWARREKIISFSKKESIISPNTLLRSFYDFDFYLANLNSESIEDFKKFKGLPPETSDFTTYDAIQKVWEEITLDRWTAIGYLTTHGFKTSKQVLTSLQNEKIQDPSGVNHRFYYLIMRPASRPQYRKYTHLHDENQNFDDAVAAVISLFDRSGIFKYADQEVQFHRGIYKISEEE